jgi:hypothetical protein
LQNEDQSVANRTTQSALLVLGAAAGVAAAAWLNKRRLSVVNTSDDELIEPESAELPLGRSADPQVDRPLSRARLPQDDTSGGALLAERAPFADEASVDHSLDEIWNAPDGSDALDESERYDAVSPESLGSVWLERATQTTHGARAHGGDLGDLLELEGMTVSEASLTSAGMVDANEIDENEIDENEIDENALGEPDESVDDNLPASSQHRD